MGQVLIRNLDDRIVETFKLRAKLKGHSLEQELREVITRAAPLSPEERVALTESVVGTDLGAATTPSEITIRDIRDRKI